MFLKLAPSTLAPYWTVTTAATSPHHHQGKRTKSITNKLSTEQYIRHAISTKSRHHRLVISSNTQWAPPTLLHFHVHLRLGHLLQQPRRTNKSALHRHSRRYDDWHKRRGKRPTRDTTNVRQARKGEKQSIQDVVDTMDIMDIMK